MTQPRAWLFRHGETEWSATGRHTGRTDIPLTDDGRAAARGLGAAVAGETFAAVWTSPLSRAADTCALAGLGDRAEVVDELREWDYGDYEGRTTAEIRTEQPGWTVWSGGCPHGESATEVGARAARVVERIRALDGDVAVFSHGHFLRVLAATWLGLSPAGGALLALGTASISILGWEREQTVLERWNAPVSG